MTTETRQWHEASQACADAIDRLAAKGYLLDSEVTDLLERFAPVLNPAQVHALVEERLARRAAYDTADDDTLFLSEAELRTPDGPEPSQVGASRLRPEMVALPSATPTWGNADVFRARSPRHAAGPIQQPGSLAYARHQGNRAARNRYLVLGAGVLVVAFLAVLAVETLHPLGGGGTAPPTVTPTIGASPVATNPALAPAGLTPSPTATLALTATPSSIPAVSPTVTALPTPSVTATTPPAAGAGVAAVVPGQALQRLVSHCSHVATTRPNGALRQGLSRCVNDVHALLRGAYRSISAYIAVLAHQLMQQNSASQT